MSTNDHERYLVQLSDYAKRHYVKKFEKRYAKKQWAVTLRSIYADLERINENIRYKKAKVIHTNDSRRIVKLDFRVAQTKDSAHGSGNRVIALIDDNSSVATILLVYSKNEIGMPNETVKWQTEIKANFVSLRDIIK